MELKNISKSLRENIISLENLNSEIKKLQSKNFAEDEAKQKINEMLFTAISGIYDCYDFVVELETCDGENDLENFLELTKIN